MTHVREGGSAGAATTEPIRRWAAGRPPREQAGEALSSLVETGLLDLPLAGSGRTATRFAALAAIAEHDLSTARLAEGHADAASVLAEAGREHSLPEAGCRLGVWAAGPLASLRSRHTGSGFLLEGTRRWCSGARSLTHALVTSSDEDGPRLFLVDLASPGITVDPGSWPAIGMAGSDTLDVTFEKVFVPTSGAVGPPDFYLSRPGFWIGSAGVAACWYGGALAASGPLVAACAERDGTDPHAAAQRGAVAARLWAMRLALEAAASAIDRGRLAPADLRALALTVRHLAESGAQEVLERTGRATGAGPLAHDADHARRVVDLLVYIRQSHAETDLESLGETLREGGRIPGGMA